MSIFMNSVDQAGAGRAWDAAAAKHECGPATLGHPAHSSIHSRLAGPAPHLLEERLEPGDDFEVPGPAGSTFQPYQLRASRLERLLRTRGSSSPVRTRAAVRVWHYRQRDLASGVWFRLRRVLADARAADVISEEDATRLIADGWLPA
jgi:hypothetical protein